MTIGADINAITLIFIGDIMAVKLGTKLTDSQKQQRAQTRRMNKASGRLPKRLQPAELQKQRDKRRERENRRLSMGIKKR